MKLFNYFLIVFLSVCPYMHSQRLVKTVNSGWEFKLDNASEKKLVNIPHTWNAQDAFEDENSYYRGTGTYSKQIFIPENWKDQAVFMKFEAANQLSRIFLNNELIGEHIGGYTAFILELTEELEFGDENEIRIEVDNSHNADIPPLEADFNFYGGIYRDMQLIVTGKSHFQLEGEAAGNLLIKTPEVNENIAEVIFEGRVNDPNNLKIQVRLKSPKGKVIFEFEKKLDSEDFSISFQIKEPELWSPDQPNLYNLEAHLIDQKSGKITDSYSSKFGCRWFKADPGKGFFLNGKPIKLIGANRHQDFENMGNALPNSLHRKDYQMIKDMGANFIRTAHYPQDPEVYRICDELGLLVWTEVPVINDVTDSEAYHENAINMQREQILQFYNHPSIVFWGIMNEIFIRLVFTGDMTEDAKNAKIATSVELAKMLEAETKKLDTTRLSVMALHENDIYNTSGIADITDVIGWNLYFGWYTQGLENLGKFLDEQHQKYPKRPLLISEYGPGSDSRIQNNDPKPWDYSEAYQLNSHVSYLNQIMERDYMLGMAAWNFADFGSSGRQDSRPFINQKGLVNFNREPKDIYFYYKARLTEQPFVFIAGKNFDNRIINKDSLVKLKVFSNSDLARLEIDNNETKEAPVKDNIAEFNLRLSEGDHSLTAVSGDAKHYRNIKVQYRENLIENIDRSPLLINIGSHSDFIDENTGEIWISDQEFSGDFGYVGGETFQHSKSKFQGTAANIKLTNREPLFQTMRQGFEAYKFNVPKGDYTITLLFAEPNRTVSKQSIYNLSSEEVRSKNGVREFDIIINGVKVEEELNIARDYGILQAVEISYEIKSEAAINIEFKPVQGKTIISGIKLEKL